MAEQQDGIPQFELNGLSRVRHLIGVVSGKGGVGKSLVTGILATELRRAGKTVGILDADITGPSIPRMFGMAKQHATAIDEHLVPCVSKHGVKVMSANLVLQDETQPVLWRGPVLGSAIRQFWGECAWDDIDYMLVDMPPGTGDVHLSIIGELKIDSAVIVSTPQQVAVADVVRGVEMFRNENVNIPVAGIIENMAWFTPEELPENRYYLFGKGGARRFAEEHGVDFLGEIPIVQSIMEGSDEGRPAAGIDPRVEKWYCGIAEKIVEKVMKSC